MSIVLQKQLPQTEALHDDQDNVVEFPNKSARGYHEASTLLDPARDSFGILFEPFLLAEGAWEESRIEHSSQWDLLEQMMGDSCETGREIRVHVLPKRTGKTG